MTGPESGAPDIQGLDLLEPLVVNDPGDDYLRRRYVEGAAAAGVHLRAAEALKGAIRRAKAGDVRERVGLDVATLFLQEGELALARQAFLDVVVVGAGSPSALAAARRVLELEGEPGDPQAIGAALEVIAKISPEASDRHAAGVRLLAMHATKPWKEARLVNAYQALVDSPRADEALGWLRTHYEKKGDGAGLSAVYRALALRTSDRGEARTLALASLRMATDKTVEKSIERWLWFLENFGPDHDAHTQVAPLLEGAQRWVELCRVLEADLDLVPADQRASMLARIGEIQIAHVGDVAAGIVAFRRCVELDPTNAVARSALEHLLDEGHHRLEAADILEPVYQQEGAVEGQLRVLETRAWLLPDQSSRLAMLTTAMQIASAAKLPDRALALCRHAINADPSSPGLHSRYDELVGGAETPSDRLARYESALDRAIDPARRRALLHAVASTRSSTGDLAGAVDRWRQIVADAPDDYRAHEGLIDAAVELGDTDAVVSLIDQACGSLQGIEKDAMLLRKAVWLSSRGGAEVALGLARQLVERGLDAGRLEAIAEIARDHDDHALHQRVLELLVASEDAETRSRALERLGDLQFNKLGDRLAAVKSWKAAAEAIGERDREAAQVLYERALEALPNDQDAAEHLIELYASGDGWARLPEALRRLIRGGHGERAAGYLVRFHANAIEARAAEEFVALADEIVIGLGAKSPEWLIPLKRARARVLSADPVRQAEASSALQELIESLGGEEDVRAFEAFVESKPSAEERHREMRWLYAWRAAHVQHPSPVLLEWARAEEEYGEPEAATATYERVLKLEPGHPEALEAVCRGRLNAGDFVGGLEALNRLRAQVGEAERPGLNVRAAEWLWSELGRHAEAATALAPALIESPAFGPAQELGRRLLGDPAIRDEVIERFESVAKGEATRPILQFLIAAREETAGAPEGRRKWFQQIVELSAEPSEEALGFAVQGALENPDSLALWEAAERMSRRLAKPEVVARAYHRVFVESVIPAALADTLGRRMVAFEEQCAIASPASMEALLSVLDAAPGARWALDRVKLALGAQARWDELFGLYDRAIVAAATDHERADLLHEAASAAKDLAGEPRRAISYFEFLRALRPDDVAVDSALERLYEKQGLKVELIALLARRAEGITGFKLREIRRRIVILWLELGDTENASVVLDRMLDGDASVADVTDLLERVAQPAVPPSPPAHLAATRAIQRLEEHYERLNRMVDLVRVADVALVLAQTPEERSRRVREWVGYVLLASKDLPTPFEHVFDLIVGRVGGDASLASVAYKALLMRAIRVWKRASVETAVDPQNGAFKAVEALAALLMQEAKPAAAFRILYRASRLPFERTRRRGLLSASGFVCADGVGAAKRATRVFDELFDDDPADDIAAKALARFAALLDGAGQHAKLALRWEEQARIHAAAGAVGVASDCWERAGRLWETQKEWERAIAAYRQGAGLSSEVSFDALARIHVARKQWAEAVQALEWLFSHAQDTQRQVRAIQLSDVYVELDDRDRARARLEDVMPTAVSSEHTDAIRQRLMVLYRRDGVWKPLARLLSAEALRAELLDRKLELVQEACTILESKLQEPEQATALLQLALTWAPHDEALRRWLVNALESLDRWNDAASVLREQIQLSGDQRSKELSLIHHRLARALVRANRAADALAELRTASDMAPGHPSILYDLGRVALDVGEIDLAEGTYRALLLALHHPAQDLTGGAIHRADVFLDLGEIALRKGETDRAEDLIDSAFDDAIEGGADLARLETTMVARGRHELLAREEERCAERATTLVQRALALGQWADLWTGPLDRAPEPGLRIREHAGRIARDLDQETLTDVTAWTALCRVESALRDPATRDKLVASLEGAIKNVAAGFDRSQLRVCMARLLLEEPVRSDAAIAVLQSALDDDPAGRDAAEMLSDVLEREGRFDELVGALERSMHALSPEREAEKFSSAMWRLGRALEQAGRRDESRRLYESVLDREPVDGGLLSALAVRLEELGSERLADCLERCMAADPGAAANLAPRLVALRDQQNDSAGVARALEAAFAADPANASFRDRLIGHYEHVEDWAKAAAGLKRALESSPGDRKLFRRLIEAHRRAGAHEELSLALDAAVAARPKDAELLALRAAARENAGDMDGAVADLESACQADPTHLKALLEMLTRVVSIQGKAPADSHVLRLADILLKLGKPKEARVELGRLRARNPGHREALRKMADAASAEGDWGAAADAYRELLVTVQKDESPEALLRIAEPLAQAYEHAGRAAEARVLLQRTLETLAALPAVVPHLERLCEALGDFTRLAQLLLNRADSLDAGDEKIALLLRAARLSLDQGGNPAAALPILERARSAAPESVEVALLLARTQVAVGQTRAALAVLGDAVERSRGSRPQQASVYLEMGRAHLACDELVEASEALKAGFAADWKTGDIAMQLGLVSIDLDDDKTAERALLAVTTMPTRKDHGDGGVKATAFYQLAALAYAKGDVAKAKLLATKATGGDPSHDAARGLLERLNAEAASRR